MAKDLPYFKFFVSEWNDGDITLESLEAQGLFVNICAYYWSNECDVSVEKCIKKFKYEDQSLIKSLFDCGVIKDYDGMLSITFLDEQKNEREQRAIVNSLNGSKGGRPKKQKESENKPNALISLSETKGNKRREEEIREEKNKKSFDIFWNTYPKKVNKSKCLDKFIKLPDGDIEKILSSIEGFVNHKPFKDYIHPHPMTYLNQERWNDEIEEFKETKLIGKYGHKF